MMNRYHSVFITGHCSVMTDTEEMEGHTQGTPVSDIDKPPSQSDLTAGLIQLWQTRVEANVIVRIDCREIPCHKAVLMAASPYFQALFTSGMKEAISGEIEFKEMTVETFELVLEFIYTGKDIVTLDNVSSLLEAS